MDLEVQRSTGDLMKSASNSLGAVALIRDKGRHRIAMSVESVSGRAPFASRSRPQGVGRFPESALPRAVSLGSLGSMGVVGDTLG